jgi:hypothetical protein
LSVAGVFLDKDVEEGIWTKAGGSTGGGTGCIVRSFMIGASDQILFR